jgi:hypothetical protein
MLHTSNLRAISPICMKTYDFRIFSAKHGRELEVYRPYAVAGIGHDSDIVRQKILASRSMESDIAAAIEACVRQEELREQYRQFCNYCKRDLDPIEQENLGLPTFREWKEENGHA